MNDALSRTEILTLAALARLDETAYGVSIQEEIVRITGRDTSMAAVYAALDRLERQGLTGSWRSEPRPERGGRARRHFQLTDAGRHALRHERDLMRRVWDELDLEPGAGRPS